MKISGSPNVKKDSESTQKKPTAAQVILQQPIAALNILTTNSIDANMQSYTNFVLIENYYFLDDGKIDTY